jgi:hypothetical protein
MAEGVWDGRAFEQVAIEIEFRPSPQKVVDGRRTMAAPRLEWNGLPVDIRWEVVIGGVNGRRLIVGRHREAGRWSIVFGWAGSEDRRTGGGKDCGAREDDL